MQLFSVCFLFFVFDLFWSVRESFTYLLSMDWCVAWFLYNYLFPYLFVNLQLSIFLYSWIYNEPFSCLFVNIQLSNVLSIRELIYLWIYIFLSVGERHNVSYSFFHSCLKHFFLLPGMQGMQTLTADDSMLVPYKTKRGSCSCSTAGTQTTCSCCQKIVGMNSEISFYV